MEVSEDVQRFCAMMQILSSPIRVQMLERLLEGPLHCKGMQHHMGIGQPNTSYHLCLMEMNGIISKERQGKRVVFTVPHLGIASKLMALLKELPK